MVGIHNDQQWESAPNINGGFTIHRADDGQRADIDGQFAFSFSYMPEQADDAPFFKGVVHKLGLSDDNHRASGLRRLFFEAYTVAASEMRRRLVCSD